MYYCFQRPSKTLLIPRASCSLRMCTLHYTRTDGYSSEKIIEANTLADGIDRSRQFLFRRHARAPSPAPPREADLDSEGSKHHVVKDNVVVAELYCIAMMNTPRKKPEHTLPLLLREDDRPVLFESLEVAVEVMTGFKQWHPEITYEVRRYDGACSFLFEQLDYGTWMIGKEVLARR